MKASLSGESSRLREVVLKPETREEARKFISSFVTSTISKLKKWPIEELKKAYPFHSLFFPDRALPAFKEERSIVTAMGQGFYPGLAQIIAKDSYQDVHLNYSMQGALNDAACNRIEEIITELRTATGAHKRIPSRDAEIADILAHTGGGNRVIETTADIYVGDFTGGPLFVEIKTPRPNLDIAAESKKKLLYFLAMKIREGKTGASAYLAFPYNPFIERRLYAHSFTKRIMDMQREVLMGEEFWNYLGGGNCFPEILALVDEVRASTP